MEAGRLRGIKEDELCVKCRMCVCFHGCACVCSWIESKERGSIYVCMREGMVACGTHVAF